MSLTIDITRANGFDFFIGEDKSLNYVIYDDEVTTPLYATYWALKRESLDAGPAVSAATTAELATLEAYLLAHQVDPTGSSFVWTLRKGDKTIDPPLIEKTTDSPSDIVISGSPPIVVVSLYDVDTAAADGTSVVIKAGTYRYSLKRLDDGAETIVTEGDFEILAATSR